MESLRQMLRSVTVEPTMLLFSISMGLRITLLKSLMYDKVCYNYYSREVCDNLDSANMTEYQDHVQKVTSKWTFYDELMYIIPSLLMTLFISSLGNHLSQKIPLMLGPVGVMLVCLAYIPNAVYMEGHLGFMLIGPFLYGCTGGYMVMKAATMTYISTISTHQRRTTRLAIVEAMMVVGVSVAEFSSGPLIECIGYVFSFVLCVVVIILCMVYTIVWVRDLPIQQTPPIDNVTEQGTAVATNGLKSSNSTLSNVDDVKSKKRIMQKLKLIYEGVLIVRKPRLNNDRKLLILLLASYFAYYFLSFGVREVTYLFLRHSPLNWSRPMYGYYSGFSTGLHFLAVSTILPLLSSKFQVKDTMLAVIAIVSYALGDLWMGLSVYTWMVFLVPVVKLMGIAFSVCARSQMSIIVDDYELGQVMAVATLLEQVTALLSGCAYSYLLYPLTVDVYAGFCFLLSAALLLIPLALTVYIHTTSLKDEMPTIVQGEVLTVQQLEERAAETLTHFDGGANKEHQTFEDNRNLINVT